jgi:hypothetical protein
MHAQIFSFGYYFDRTSAINVAELAGGIPSRCDVHTGRM